MSRIGKLPIEIPEGVTVSLKGSTIIVKGPKGENSFTFHPRMKITFKDQQILVERSSKSDSNLHGLTRTLIANLIAGIQKGFEKKLEIHGVGYRAEVKGNKLILLVGFSHPIEYTAPPGITFSLDPEKKNILAISGFDKQLVGEAAAKIRSFRKPEPYKGKGIRYLGEKIRLKAGKTAIGTGAVKEG